MSQWIYIAQFYAKHLNCTRCTTISRTRSSSMCAEDTVAYSRFTQFDRQWISDSRTPDREGPPTECATSIPWNDQRCTGAGWLIVDVDRRRRRLGCSSWPDTLVLCSPDTDGPWQPACTPRVQERWVSEVDRESALKERVLASVGDEAGRRIQVALQTSHSPELTKPVKHATLAMMTCFSRLRSDEKKTPRTQTWSLGTTVSSPSCRYGPLLYSQYGCVVSRFLNQLTVSVYSALNFSRQLADMQWLTPVRQRSSLSTADVMSSRPQCTVQLIVVGVGVEIHVILLYFLSKVRRI